MAQRAWSFAQRTSVPTAQRVAASLPHLRDALIGNGHLVEDVWFSFLQNKKKKLKVADARSLVARPLSDAQVRYLIEHETRESVLCAMLDNNRLTSGQLEAVLSAKSCTSGVTEKLLNTQPETLSCDWLREAGLKGGGVAMLEYMLQASPEEMPDAEMGEHLRAYATWAPTWDGGRITRLIHQRPQLIGDIIASGHQKALTAVAGCRFLTDVDTQYAIAGLRDPEAANPTQQWLDDHAYTWMTLVWNPVTALEVVEALDPLLQRQQEKPDSWYAAQDRKRGKPAPVTVPFDEETDPKKLSWLVKRVAGNKARPHDFLVVARNPHLGVGEAETLLRGTVAHDPLSRLLVPGSPEDAAVAALEAKFPELVEGGLGVDLARARANAVKSPEERLADRHEAVRATTYTYEDKYIERGGTLHVAELDYNECARLYFERAMTDANANTNAWMFAFSKMDEFAGTVADLAMVANAVGMAAAA